MTTRITITAFFLFLASACVQESLPVDSDEQLLMTVNEPIVETSRGYQIAMPARAADTIPTDRRIKLTVANRDGRTSSVIGTAERSSTNASSVTLVTSESIELPLANPGTVATLAEPDDIFGCLPAEFGIDCFADSFVAVCAGTIYCLPGFGPGGFTCECI